MVIEMILDSLKSRCEEMLRKGPELVIEDAAVCHPYTYVIVKDPEGKRALGACLTPLLEMSNREVWQPPRFPEGGQAAEALKMANSIHMVERVLGIATLNAISQYFLDLEKLSSGLIEDIVYLIKKELRKGSKVAVVGYMTPLVNELRSLGYDVIVFERDRSARRDALSDCLEPRLLPQADAVIISGATLLNDTLDKVLEYSKNAKMRALIGSTAQAHPDILKGTGLTHVASVRVIDIDEVRKAIKLTAWRDAFFGKYVRSYTIRLK